MSHRRLSSGGFFLMPTKSVRKLTIERRQRIENALIGCITDPSSEITSDSLNHFRMCAAYFDIHQSLDRMLVFCEDKKDLQAELTVAAVVVLLDRLVKDSEPKIAGLADPPQA
jgi:hypothetical protein